GPTDEAAGAFAVVPGTDLPAVRLHAGPGKYGKLTWDEKHARLAFLHAARPDRPGARAKVRLYCWARPATATASFPGLPSLAAGPWGGLPVVAAPAAARAAVERAPAGGPALGAGGGVSDRADRAFPPDGTRLFFGAVRAAPVPPPDVQKAEEKAVVEL